jgi:osmoprotectant transport system permease protein
MSATGPRLRVILLSLTILLTGLFGRSAEPMRVGSKGFTESVILGELLKCLAEESGVKVEHLSELGGSQVLWKALLGGDIDLYVDYTGTIREELLGEDIKQGLSIRSEEDMRQALRKHDVVMSERLGFNNTYALGMREDDAASREIHRITDLRNHLDLKFGFSDEFMERNDGWPKLAEKYQLKHREIRTMDHNLAYRGMAGEAIDVTDIYSTDAEIEYYQLRVLEDDLGYFPTYFAVVLMREDVSERFPKGLEGITKIEGLIDSQAMARMSAKVRLEHQLEANVAAQFVNEKLGSKIPLQSTTKLANWQRIASRLFRTTQEHLFLVVISLLAAMAIAVPLGILSARNESMGQVILAVVGVIQTLPSMAILVFMIPLFGLGPLPAIVALFFYSLLPIVRNTYTGLTQIPTAILESADVLGLNRQARLRLVELPLALPSILAGIKTAAVINVGTATIGALIGAGGYGSPILTGIRLSSIPLILQGAIPAAILAVLVQLAFSVLEKGCVSPGLLKR